MLKTCETPHFRSALASLSRGKRKAAHVRTTPPIHKMAIKKGRVLILAIGRGVNLLSSFFRSCHRAPFPLQGRSALSSVTNM